MVVTQQRVHIIPAPGVNPAAFAPQTAFGNITATPSGLSGRKLLAAPRQMYHHSADIAAGSGGTKPKCPLARLRELGLVQGLF